MQHIKSIRWFSYQIPFRASFTTAHGTLHAREGAIVEVITDGDLSGIGDIAPMPEFAGDDLATALAPLSHLSSQFLGWQLLDALVSLYTEENSLPATTICGLESALLDAIGKSMGCSAMDVIEHPRRREQRHLDVVPVNMVIGALATENAVARALEAIEMGYTCIKLKMMSGQPEAEIERIAAVRAALGSTIHLRLDANEGWTLPEAITILSQSATSMIQYVEQPLPATDLAGMHTLRDNVSVPIAADEALSDRESAHRILAHDAADVLIIKPQLAGGLRMGRQIISEATQHGVQCVITSTLESGVGIAGALHLAAASPEVTMECGLATLHLLADDLLVDGLTLDHGSLAVPTSPGLGVYLDRNALAFYKKH